MSRLCYFTLTALALLIIAGCPGPAGTTDTSGGDTTGSGDVSDNALSFGGNLDGTVALSTSSDGTIDDGQSGRGYFLRMQTSGGSAWLTDLAGNPLVDANGQPYENITVGLDGSFSMNGLPVGVDFMMHIDFDGDGVADLQSIFFIPAHEGDVNAGTLDGAVVDPLSTLGAARMLAILEELGITPADLDMSPALLIEQIRDAFSNLFETNGILTEIDIEDLQGMTPAEWAQLFDTLLPAGARNGMNMARHRLRMSQAADAAAVAEEVAQILVQSGMAIADGPGGPDFSALATLPNVETLNFEQFYNQQFEGMVPETSADPFETGQMMPEFDLTIYVSTTPEVNRNEPELADEGMHGHHGPMIGDWQLERMAAAYLAGQTITLEQLHQLLVDPNQGLGIRLLYSTFVEDPFPMWVEVFETADGQGTELNMMDFMETIMNEGLGTPDPERWQEQEQNMRGQIAQFLQGTIQPSFERVMNGILTPRIAGVEQYARMLRQQRVHIPWSLSGPSQIYVVADADPWVDSEAQAITVDAETNSAGEVTSVTYNTAGTGAFYVAVGWPTETGHMVELINRSNGRPLHAFDGELQQLDLADTTIFQNVGSQTFYEAFSQTEDEWPLAPMLTISNPEFDPSQPADPETNPMDFEGLVLMTDYTFNADPVQVSYDESTGVATYDTSGEYYLLADHEYWNDGRFTLVTEGGEPITGTTGGYDSRERVIPADVVGLDIQMQSWTWVYGIDVPNPGYDPEGAPYYDDFNGNGQFDTGEPTFAERHMLWDPNDWRSTWVERYYRTADSASFINPENVDWMADQPRLLDGTPLVPRVFRTRLNGYRFGKPNVAINLLSAFSPPQLFNGTQGMAAQTQLNPFQVIAMIHLVLDSTQTTEAYIDIDGPGPLAPQLELVPAWWFVPPVGDPVQLIMDGFEDLAQ